MAHAVKLVQLLKGLNCRVNLIRYHDSATDPNFKASQPLTIQRFQSFLNKQGITCTLRTSRGEDIMAACGLLAKVKGGDA